MVDVFISYSRKDEALAGTLARAVEAEGYDVWWDAELPPHKSYGDVITDKIAEAKAGIVVWSADAVKSEWVRAEADMSRNQRKLIQTVIDGVSPPLPFNQIQYAEIGDWRGEADHSGWRKVKASLAELCGREPLPEEPRAHRRETPKRPPAPPQQVRTAAPRWPVIAALAALVVVVVGATMLYLRRPAMRAEGGDRAAAFVPARGHTTAGLAPGIEILPFSSDRLLTEADIAPLGKGALWIARNEIFARHGRRFRDAQLVAWFEHFSWYRPTTYDVPINPIERENVRRLLAAENAE